MKKRYLEDVTRLESAETRREKLFFLTILFVKQNLKVFQKLHKLLMMKVILFLIFFCIYMI